MSNEVPQAGEISYREAAKRLGVSTCTITNMIADGRLHCRRSGRRAWFSESVINALSVAGCVTAKEAAKLLGASPDTIRLYVRSGKLPSRRQTGRRWIPIAAIEALKPKGEHVTITEAARMLQCSRNIIFKMVLQGKLPSVRFKKCFRIPVDALRSLSETLPAEPSVTVPEAARMLGRTKPALRRAVLKGHVPGTRLSAHWRIPVSVIEELKNTVTPQEAARRVGISEDTLRKHIRQGKLAVYRHGRSRARILISELERFTITEPSASPVEAAERLHVNLATIQHYINDGRIPSKKIGQHRYIPITALEELLPSTEIMFTRPEAAEKIGIQPISLKKYTCNKTLPARYIGMNAWIKESDLAALVKAHKWGNTLRGHKPTGAALEKLKAQAESDRKENAHSLANTLYFRARDERTAQAITWRGFSEVLRAGSTVTLHADPPNADGECVIKIMLRVSLGDLKQSSPGIYTMPAVEVDRITRDCFVDANVEPGLEEEVYDGPARRWQLK